MRWLLENAVRGQQPNQTAVAAAAAPSGTASLGAGVVAAQSSQSGDSFDANMVIILAALLCALILALGLNSILRCALRCTSSTSPSSSSTKAPRGGLKKGALRKLPITIYDTAAAAEGGIAATECPICLGDFVDGDQVRALPGCGHGFHARCVDAWLVSNSSCPTCRRSLLAPERDSAAKAQVVPAAAEAEPRTGYRARAFFLPSVLISPPPPMV